MSSLFKILNWLFKSKRGLCLVLSSVCAPVPKITIISFRFLTNPTITYGRYFVKQIESGDMGLFIKTL